MLFSSDLLRDYPAIHDYFAHEQPSISTLHFIGGTSLFMFVGTVGGTVWATPVSARVGEPLVLVEDRHRGGAAVRYIRVFNGNLFVSWEDGWLGVYNVQNIASHLEIFKINRAIEDHSRKNEVWTTDLHKMKVLEEKLSSFMKYSLPAYHSA